MRYRRGESAREFLDYVEQVNRMNLLLPKTCAAWIAIDEVLLLANRYYLDDVLQYENEIVPQSMLSPAPDAFLHLDKVF